VNAKESSGIFLLSFKFTRGEDQASRTPARCRLKWAKKAGAMNIVLMSYQSLRFSGLSQSRNVPVKFRIQPKLDLQSDSAKACTNRPVRIVRRWFGWRARKRPTAGAGPLSGWPNNRKLERSLPAGNMADMTLDATGSAQSKATTC